MDKNELKRLAGLNEDKWSGEVHTKKHPPEGLFANGTTKTIVKWLKDNHKEFKSAMSALNFFINRSGKNLTTERKAELESTKDALRKAYNISKTNESLDMMRKLAGLPKLVREKEDDEEDDEEESGEEAEEVPSIVASIAKKAEGLTGDELVTMIQKVYDAGVEDGKTQATEEEAPEEEITESGHISTTANSSALVNDVAQIVKRTVNDIPLDSAKSFLLQVDVKRTHYQVFTYKINVTSKTSDITESVKDSTGKEIKVGDRLVWSGRGGEGTGVVVADAKYNGGMRVGGQAVKYIIDEYDSVKVVK